MSGNTSYPARVTVMLPLVPKISRPKPARRPALASRRECTAVACHLANISLRLGRKIHWDPEREEIAGDPEASALLVRPYRKPWDEVLRSFHL